MIVELSLSVAAACIYAEPGTSFRQLSNSQNVSSISSSSVTLSTASGRSQQYLLGICFTKSLRKLGSFSAFSTQELFDANDMREFSIKFVLM